MGERTPSQGVKAAVNATRLVFDAKTVAVILSVAISVGASYMLQRTEIDQSIAALASEIQRADARTQLQLSELRSEMTTRAELERVRLEYQAEISELRSRVHTLDVRVGILEAKLDSRRENP